MLPIRPARPSTRSTRIGFSFPAVVVTETMCSILSIQSLAAAGWNINTSTTPHALTKPGLRPVQLRNGAAAGVLYVDITFRTDQVGEVFNAASKIMVIDATQRPRPGNRMVGLALADVPTTAITTADAGFFAVVEPYVGPDNQGSLSPVAEGNFTLWFRPHVTIARTPGVHRRYAHGRFITDWASDYRTQHAHGHNTGEPPQSEVSVAAERWWEHAPEEPPHSEVSVAAERRWEHTSEEHNADTQFATPTTTHDPDAAVTWRGRTPDSDAPYKLRPGTNAERETSTTSTGNSDAGGTATQTDLLMYAESCRPDILQAVLQLQAAVLQLQADATHENAPRPRRSARARTPETPSGQHRGEGSDLD
jgi:hypothetical protein